MSERIAVDLYDGAYGPTLRIDVGERTALQFLRDALKGMAEGTVPAFDIVPGDRFELSGIGGVHLAVAKDDGFEGLRRKTRGATPTFTWNLEKDEWRRCLALIDGLLEANGPGHQYLTTEGEDDALVEVAFLEGSGLRK
jgi:hypothetical protein